MKDQLESTEDAADDRLRDMSDGLPVGKFRCGCGRITDLADSTPSSPSPFADPMCQKCVELEGLRREVEELRCLMIGAWPSGGWTINNLPWRKDGYPGGNLLSSTSTGASNLWWFPKREQAVAALKLAASELLDDLLEGKDFTD